MEFISRSTANALFPGVEAVGLELPVTFLFGKQPKARVMGVVGDVVYRGLGAQAAGSICLPYDEMPLLDMYLAVRSEAGLALAATIRARIHEIAPEIAIRLALGATPRRIRALVLREELVVTIAGLAVGAGVGLLAGQALASRLYGVAPWDPITLVAAAATILVATLLATWIPARRATKASLGELLRSA